MTKKVKFLALSALAISAFSAGCLTLPASVSSLATTETPVAIDTAGAEVRTTGDDGMRFFGSVDKATYDAAKQANESVRAGIILLPQKLLGESELTHGVADIEDIEAKNWHKDSTQEDYVFTGVLAGTVENGEVNKYPTALYGKAIVARAYYYDGADYHYSDATVTRSIANVASKAIAGGESGENLVGYIDGAIGENQVNVTSSVDGHANAGDTVTFTTDIKTYVEDGMEATWASNSADFKLSVATGENAEMATTIGGNDVTVSASYGSKQFSCAFDVWAEYTKGFYYEDANGEYVANAEFTTSDKLFAAVGSNVAISEDTSAEKYMLGGGYEVSEASVISAEVAASGTALKAMYSQIALTEEGLLADANRGTWQLVPSYNSNTTNPVTIEKSTDVVTDGKSASFAINWNGGYYTYVRFNTKNAITDHGAYNAIAFKMKNDAVGSKAFYVYSLQQNATKASQEGVSGIAERGWAYFVMPLDGSALKQDEISLLFKFSNGYDATFNGVTTGKTYLSDFKLINYTTPDNTLIDFGYSTTGVNVATTWGDVAGSSARIATGIKDPVTGGSTLKIQDKDNAEGSAAGPWRYRDSYGFHLGQTQNNGGNMPYTKLTELWNNKGEATGIKISMRVYCESDNRGFDGYYVKPFDHAKDWTWIPAKTKEEGGTGKISGQWTTVSFTMTELPTQSNARFYITTLGGWTGASTPTADGNAAMSALYISSVTWEYVTA